MRRGPSRQPLDVANSVERVPQALAAPCVVHQHLECVETRGDAVHRAQRRQQPLPEQARPHGGDRPIQYLEQRSALLARAHRLGQLEVAPRHLVQRHRGAYAPHRRRRELRQAARLQFARVLEQCPRRAEGRPVGIADPEAFEPPQSETPRNLLGGLVGVELPRFTLCDHELAARGWHLPPLRHDDLARVEAGERDLEVIHGHGLQDELAGRQIQRREPDRIAGEDRHQEVVACAVQPLVGEDRAGAHRLDHLAPHHPLGVLWILHLLANGYPVAAFHEAPQVPVGGLDRHARQRDLGGGAAVAARECQAQFPSGELRVVEEHLVEVAHAEKQNRIGMARLDCAVLLHQRGLGLRRRALPSAHCCSSTTNGLPPSRCLSSATSRWAALRSGKRPTRTLKSPSAPRTTWGS